MQSANADYVTVDVIPVSSELCKKKMSCVKFAFFDTHFRHFWRNSFSASSLHRFQPTSTIRSVFLAKLCMKFVNNYRVCSSHVGNQGNHCRRQESDPISPTPAAKSPPLLPINSSYFWPTLKSTPAFRCLPSVLLLTTGALVLLALFAALSPNKRLVFRLLNAFRVC